MAAKYQADSSQNDEGNEVTDSPVGLDSANQAAPAYTKQEENPPGSSPSKMVGGHEHSAALTSQEKKKPKCTLKTAIGEAPHTENLIRKLQILLDPPKPLGGDIKSLASAFKYTSNDIYFLTSKPYGSPTEVLLRSEGHHSIEFLLEKLVYIKREDAAGKLREYISMQECKCKDCQTGLC